MDKLNESELLGLAKKLFDNQYSILSLWQTTAEHFYPERADFTVTRNIGQELADNVIDSTPQLFRRDFCNSFASMLREDEWFNMGVKGAADFRGKQWLQWATQQMRDLMDDPSSQFTRATKQGDHDYGTFGQCVISVEPNKLRNGILYRNWHLRDCAWFEDETGEVCGVVRKWNPTVRDLIQTFGEKNVHPDIKTKFEENPQAEHNCYHIFLPVDMRGGSERESMKYVSIFIDIANGKIMEETEMSHKYYVIPRFQTIAGSPYAYSPATVVGLPNSRMLQAMTFTLMEAAERYARPPLIATQKVIRSDVNLEADGITWVDEEYDERTGAALRPMTQDRGGFPIGHEMRDEVKMILNSAFYLDKLNMPQVDKEMTAYEVSELMKKYRREVLPLFSPLEKEYNGQLCELSFEIAFRNGFLGSPMDVPPSLLGRDYEFKFKSPLSATEEEKRQVQFRQMSEQLAMAMQFEEGVKDNVNIDAAFRDAMTSTGTPMHWMFDPEQVAAQREMSMQQDMAMLEAQGDA